MDYDELILKCIENSFKSVREISNETDIPYNRVNIRMNSLKKNNCVLSIQSNSKTVGIKPCKYKKNIN